MITKASNLWYRIRSSFWFLPALMAALSIALAFFTIFIDETVRLSFSPVFRLFLTSTAAGARDLLSMVAGSMITIAGVVFSITIVSLSLASQQFGPRLLANFMRDTGNQIVLGTFTATFLYCVLILLTVRDGGTEFVPRLSITVAIILAVLSLAVLIYFIHHSSSSIQADNLIARVSSDMERSINKLFPEHFGTEPGEQAPEQDIDSLSESFEREGQQILADSKGYLQAVDSDGLMALAVERDLVLWLKNRPGDFIVKDSCVALVWPGGSVDEDAARQVNRSIILGNQRTLEQDVLLAFKQLTEIAVRAISPAINDPFTAETCTDELVSGLCQLAGRAIPSPYRHDDNGSLRVIAEPFSFEDALKASFNTIRQHAQSNAAVTIYLMRSLEVVAQQTRRQADKTAILRQAETIFRSGQDNLSEESDRREVEKGHRKVLTALSRKPTGPEPQFTT